MNTKDIDILNVILIIAALWLAFNVPFGLFLFSYAFLGPLHYLTEINWLNEKKYFVKNTAWIWPFLCFGVLLGIPFLLRSPIFSFIYELSYFRQFAGFIETSGDEFLLVGLLFAIALIHLKKRIQLLLFFLGSVAIALPILHFFPDFALGILIFLPTVVHVFLFTLLFMVYGTIQSKSTPGIIAIVLMILVPVIIMMSKVNPAEYNNLSEYIKKAFDDSGFGIVSTHLAKMIGTEPLNYLSVIGIKIQIFIAFAYTYHYLNWFSKTSIIGWGKNMSKNKGLTIIGIWLFSVAIYLYNYKIGFIALSFLSLVHVFLEFPLNVISIKGILLKLKSN